MNIKYTIKTAIRALKTNKSRTALTILGIVIGITAIMMVMSLGQGAQNLILDQIRGFGSQTIDIEPGRMPQAPSDFSEMMTDSLKPRDFEALKKLPGVKQITPSVFQPVSIIYENETERGTLIGASELFAEILDVYPAEGDYFTDDDIKQYANLAVIGSTLKQNLFGDSNALGQKIKIRNRSFKIIGVLGAKGKMVGFDIDKMVVVPYTTAQKYLLGINYFNGGIIIKAENEEIMTALIKDIEFTLRDLHNISDSKKDDFHIITQEGAMEQVATIMNILTLFLAAVAAISLLVGGVGIMNIMLVSVTERTREIGLRKALGATKKDVLMQFLLEAVTLTATGGIIGIMLGSGLSFVVAWGLSKSLGTGWLFSFPVSAALLGLGVASLVGLVFGIYPARQAASKSPIEALRYE